MTVRDVLAAFKAKVEAGASMPVYVRGKVPNTPPASYTVLDLSTPTVGDYSAAARSASRAWTISALYVGTSIESCLFRAEEAEVALLDQRLSVAGLNCSRMKRAPGRTVGPDPDVEGVCSGSDLWSFVTTNA